MTNEHPKFSPGDVVIELRTGREVTVVRQVGCAVYVRTDTGTGWLSETWVHPTKIQRRTAPK